MLAQAAFPPRSVGSRTRAEDVPTSAEGVVRAHAIDLTAIGTGRLARFAERIAAPEAEVSQRSDARVSVVFGTPLGAHRPRARAEIAHRPDAALIGVDLRPSFEPEGGPPLPIFL